MPNQDKTLEEAFREVIFTRGIYKKLGYKPAGVKTLRRYFTAKQLSTDKMREILTNAGWIPVQIEKWAKK